MKTSSLARSILKTSSSWYAAGISSIPTFMAFRENVLVFLPGAINAQQLDHLIDQAPPRASIRPKCTNRSKKLAPRPSRTTTNDLGKSVAAMRGPKRKAILRHKSPDDTLAMTDQALAAPASRHHRSVGVPSALRRRDVRRGNHPQTLQSAAPWVRCSVSATVHGPIPGKELSPALDAI